MDDQQNPAVVIQKEAEAEEPLEEEVVETAEEREQREALEKLQKQMVAQQNVVFEHRKKLTQLEKVLAQKKQEEEELGKNFFGVAATISSVGTTALMNPAASTKEYGVEELEKLRDALKTSLMIQ